MKPTLQHLAVDISDCCTTENMIFVQMGRQLENRSALSLLSLEITGTNLPFSDHDLPDLSSMRVLEKITIDMEGNRLSDGGMARFIGSLPSSCRMLRLSVNFNYTIRRLNFTPMEGLRTLQLFWMSGCIRSIDLPESLNAFFFNAF